MVRLDQGWGIFLAERAIKVVHVKIYLLKSHAIFLAVRNIVLLEVLLYMFFMRKSL